MYEIKGVSNSKITNDYRVAMADPITTRQYAAATSQIFGCEDRIAVRHVFMTQYAMPAA